MPIENPAYSSVIRTDLTESEFPLIQPGGRLTLNRAEPAAGGTNATQLFYVPYVHPFVPVINPLNGLWNYFKLPDDGVIVSSSQNAGGHLDIFASTTNGENFSIQTQFWTSTAARFRPIVLNGLQCVDFGEGSNPRYCTYLGSARTSGTGSNGVFNDGNLFRHVWNLYNQVEKGIQCLESAASWTYSSSTARVLNNNAANRIEVLAGLGGGRIHTHGRFSALASAGRTAVFAQDFNGAFDGSTQVILNDSATGENSATNQLISRAVVGLNTIRPLEAVAGGQAITIYGYGRAGLTGFWYC